MQAPRSRLTPFIIIVVCLATGALAGCGGPQDIEELPRALSASEKQLIDSNTRWSFALLGQTVATRGADTNLFLSPLSASMALGMAHSGAAGDTKRAFAKTLAFGDMSDEQIRASYKGLIELLRGLDPRVSLELANSLWHRDTFEIKKPYLERVAEFFFAPARALDFDSPAAAKTINDWVRESTRGKIDGIAPDPIGSETMLLLVNALYFKGSWHTQFAKSATRPGPFTLPDGATVNVPMMTMLDEGPMLSARGDGFDAVDVPYGGRAFSMLVLLPDAGTDIWSFARSLDHTRYSQTVSQLAATTMTVTMPKVELHWQTSLVKTLEALGLGVAFDDGRADFSGISETPLFISEVKHKAYVKIDEEGTEAAAATSVGADAVSLPRNLLVDRPFVFAIRERLSGTVLFVGVVSDPR